MKKALVIFIIGCLIIGGGIFWVLQRNSSPTSQAAPSIAPQQGSIQNHVRGTPIREPFATVTITTKGLSPSKVEIKEGNLIHFINKTPKTIEIVTISNNKIILGPIETNKVEVSLPFNIKGEYDYTIKGNNSLKGSILVQ